MSGKWLRLVLEKNELFPKWKTFENKKAPDLLEQVRRICMECDIHIP